MRARYFAIGFRVLTKGERGGLLLWEGTKWVGYKIWRV